jgi:hypothetical protein
MFLSTLQQPAKRKQQAVSYSEASLFPVLTAEKLVSGAEMQQLLEKVTHWAALPSQYYNEFYQPLIDQFAEYAQILPNQQGRIGGVLLESLQQACLALQISHEDAVGEIDPLFIYALFSATLLQTLPRFFYKTTIICDEKGAALNTWSPLAGSLVEAGNYYKVRDYGLRDQQLKPYLRILLANKMMPAVGLQWLAEDKDIFSMWLYALGAEEEGSETLGLILNRAKMASTGLTKDYLPVGVKVKPAEATMEGDACFSWLKEELVKQPNWELVRVSENGLVLSEGVFQKFSELHPQYPDWRKVVVQFKKLGCTAEVDKKELVDYEAELPVNKNKQMLRSKNEIKNSRQGQNFFNQNKNQQEEQQRKDADFKDCLVMEEKNLLRQLLRNTQLQKQLQQQQTKKLAKKRIALAIYLLRKKIRAKKKRLLAIKG